MKLAPGERSILSYFPSSNQAQKAVDALKNAGLSETRLDRVSRYGVTTDANYNNPINNAATLTGVTLFSEGTSDELDPDARVLAGADPSVSGYGAKDYGVAGGKAFLVTVVTNEEKLDQAVEIIKKYGGSV